MFLGGKYENIQRIYREPEKNEFKVYLMGKEVKTPTEDPMIRPSLNSVAMTYELAEKAEEHEI